MNEPKPEQMRLCPKHSEAGTVAKRGTVFYCPLCKDYWTVGDNAHRRLRYDNRGIV